MPRHKEGCCALIWSHSQTTRSRASTMSATPPCWPESTRRISQLRIVLEYESAKFWKRRLGYDRLTIDIVDYPGEWLLDLPLLRLDYAAWSQTALRESRMP